MDFMKDGHGQTYIPPPIYICSKFHEILLWGYLVIANYIDF